MAASADSENNVCTIEATVTTGFESTAQEESEEKLQVRSKWERGRIFFDIPVERASEVLKLRGVDNLYVVVQDIKNFGFPDDKELVKEKLASLASQVDWKMGIEVWQKLTGYNALTLDQILSCGDTSEMMSDLGESSDAEQAIPSFRVTCNRTGEKHCFSSMEAASYFGAAINDLLHWKVKMKQYDIEVVLNINENNVYVCLALTEESLHYRNLEYFGPTSMRATIAYNLLRLAKIQPGDVTCDPMCGGGSIPIEAALNWPSAFHICGDNHEMAWPRTLQNVNALNRKLQDEGKGSLRINVFGWDARNLPLRNSCIDVFVTDLPFGKRMGSKWDNRTLYPQVLDEMARCAKPGKARAVLLTSDRKSLSKAVGRCSKFWRQARVVGVNMGGLSTCAYILHRTLKAWPSSAKETNQCNALDLSM